MMYGSYPWLVSYARGGDWQEAWRIGRRHALGDVESVLKLM